MTTRGKSRYRLIPLSLVLALVIAACNSTTSGDSPTTGLATDTTAEGTAGTGGGGGSEGDNVLKVAAVSTIRLLDPHYHGGAAAQTALRHVYDRLVVREGSENVGQLAESWEMVDDLTWDFKLREDVYFHDGEHMTAEDVKASFDKMIENDETNLVGHWTDLDSTEVVDDYTFRIRTKTPKGNMLVSLEVFFVAPAHELETPDYLDRLVGSGPFRFVEWIPDNVLRLEANDEYWGGAPEIDGLEYYTIPEMSSRVTALLAGDIHVLPGVEPDDLATIEENPDTFTILRSAWPTNHLIINHLQEKFQDIRVRRAMWLAIDLPTIAESVFPPGYATVLRTTVSQAALGAIDQGEPPYDPEQAQQLLAEAGYDEANPLPVTLTYVTGEGILVDEIVTLVASYWEAVGIDVAVEGVDDATHVDAYGTLNWETNLNSNSGILGDVASAEGRTLHTDDPRYGYSNPEMDRLIEHARQQLDPEAAFEAWGDVQRYAWEDVPRLWLFELSGAFGVRNEVGNFEPSADAVRSDYRDVTLDG